MSRDTDKPFEGDSIIPVSKSNSDINESRDLASTEQVPHKVVSTATLNETNDEEDFICIIDDSTNPEESFEFIDAQFAKNDTSNYERDYQNRLTDVINTNESLFVQSILGIKSSNISLNTLDSESNNRSDNQKFGTSHSYSVESLNLLSDLPESKTTKTVVSPTSKLEVDQKKGEPISNSLIRFDQLQQWIYCIAVVNFDIEIGQSIECIFPPGAHLTERESSNICYLSFPDSNSGCMGDTQFYFRTKTCPIKRPCFDRFYANFNRNCLQVLQVEQEYLYGYVYFRQVKDCASRRGYFQKSLVVLSWFPFVSLFSRVLKILAPEFFAFSVTSLEAACGDIDRWPAPLTGQVLSLPLLGKVIQAIIPDEKYNFSSMCQSNHVNLKKFSTSSISLRSLSLLKIRKSSKDSSLDIVGPDGLGDSSLLSPNIRNLVVNVSNDINVYRALLPVIGHVQLLWELVLTCEPMVVIAQSPNICSEVVHALTHCIAPLKYGSDYRPFFTIHDSELKEYTGHRLSPPPVILGVTNPFFVKTLQEWPHIIKITEAVEDNSKINVNMHSGTKKCPNNKTLEIKTGVYTKYKTYLLKDREILKKLLKGIESSRPSEAQNVLLRRFFIELTQSFLIPLERYFASLMPLAKNLSPFKRPPILQQFKIDDFISTLDTTGPQLTSGIKGDWTGLYRRFLRSPNFVCWYSNRMQEANDKLRALHIEAICDSKLPNLVQNRPEIEIVDLILKMQENLSIVTKGQLNLSTSTVDRLRANIRDIIQLLPADSRQLFEKSPCK